MAWLLSYIKSLSCQNSLKFFLHVIFTYTACWIHAIILSNTSQLLKHLNVHYFFKKYFKCFKSLLAFNLISSIPHTVKCNIYTHYSYGIIGCLHMTSMLWSEMQLECRKGFLSIGISSRNTRCLCFALFMLKSVKLRKHKELLSCTKKCFLYTGGKV